MKNKKRIVIGVVGAIILVLLGLVYVFVYLPSRPQPHVPIPGEELLPKYTAETLIKYDGTDEALPIYMALDGYVYDVTLGKSYYGPSGTYHSLAGKDASKELPVFVGDIVKGKYKIVGVFLSQQ